MILFYSERVSQKAECLPRLVARNFQLGKIVPEH